MDAVYGFWPEDEAAETEFRQKVQEVQQINQKEDDRQTADGEWTLGELRDQVYCVAVKVLLGDGTNGKGWLEKHEHYAMLDKYLVDPDNLVAKMIEDADLVQIYDSYRNDGEEGIDTFERLMELRAIGLLEDNLVNKG